MNKIIVGLKDLQVDSVEFYHPPSGGRGSGESLVDAFITLSHDNQFQQWIATEIMKKMGKRDSATADAQFDPKKLEIQVTW